MYATINSTALYELIPPKFKSYTIKSRTEVSVIKVVFGEEFFEKHGNLLQVPVLLDVVLKQLAARKAQVGLRLRGTAKVLPERVSSAEQAVRKVEAEHFTDAILQQLGHGILRNRLLQGWHLHARVAPTVHHVAPVTEVMRRRVRVHRHRVMVMQKLRLTELLHHFGWRVIKRDINR